MSSRPAVVLVPGAWHTGDSYTLTTKPLASAGYSCTRLSLPSLYTAEKSKRGDPVVEDLSDDVKFIQAALSAHVDQGQNVILVMHSYGGVPGTESVKGFTRSERLKQGLQGGVVHLIYLASFMIPVGESLAGVAKTLQTELKGGVTRQGGTAVITDMQLAKHHFYNDIDQELVDTLTSPACSILVPQALGPLCCPLTYAAYRHVPTTYLLCKNDNTLTFTAQKQLVEWANTDNPIKVETVTCEAGHSPFLSMPTLVVELIQNIADGYKE